MLSSVPARSVILYLRHLLPQWVIINISDDSATLTSPGLLQVQEYICSLFPFLKSVWDTLNYPLNIPLLVTLYLHLLRFDQIP